MTNNVLENAPVVATPSAVETAAVQRSIAEVQSALTIAQRFPRDEKKAIDRIINAFSRPRLAEAAEYQYARGGTDISGPSIRAAEAIATSWGNVWYGIDEVSRSGGTSDCVAYAWDLETNVRAEVRFKVKHIRDTRKGSYALTDERDIYERVFNDGGRRLRACILRIVPKDVQDAAIEQAHVTLQAEMKDMKKATENLVEAFKKIGVTSQMIEKRIQRRLNSITPAQIVNLRAVGQSISDGMSVVSDWFEVEEEPKGEDSNGNGGDLGDLLDKKGV